MKVFSLLFLLILLLHAGPAGASSGMVLPRGSIIVPIHLILALLALRRIWAHDANGRFWQVAWSLLAAGVPFFGPILFFGLADMPQASDKLTRVRGGFVTGRSGMDYGQAGGGGIPALNDLIAEILEGNLLPEENNTLEKCRALAEKGDARAQTRLGMLHEYGDGIAIDYAAALAWYRKAADQGFAPAQALLAEMYGKGTGVEKNPEEACFWLSLATTSDRKFAPIRDQYVAVLKPDRFDAVCERMQAWTPVVEAAESKN